MYENTVSVLLEKHDLPREQLLALLKNNTPGLRSALAAVAAAVCRRFYGDEIYVRGLIEFTNICRNDCYYCGIRRGNSHLHRYRLTPGQILDCCREGHKLGFRTFVLQGGEDPWYTEARVTELCRAIKSEFPDCALTLSIGEWPDASYQKFYSAGADRYLLRHETADDGHYRMLHPLVQMPENRKRCLFSLKRIGYQTGSGFIPQSSTPFAHAPAGTLEMTLLCISLLRLFFPRALIPATTALGTICSRGRELGMLAGANVVMPNLSPRNVRGDYALYDHKISTGAEAAECLSDLESRMKAIGRRVVMSRGDVCGFSGR